MTASKTAKDSNHESFVVSIDLLLEKVQKLVELQITSQDLNEEQSDQLYKSIEQIREISSSCAHKIDDAISKLHTTIDCVKEQEGADV